MDDVFPLVSAMVAMAMLAKRKGQKPASETESPTAEDYRRMEKEAEEKRAEEQRKREEMERCPRAYKRRAMKALKRTRDTDNV